MLRLPPVDSSSLSMRYSALLCWRGTAAFPQSATLQRRHLAPTAQELRTRRLRRPVSRFGVAFPGALTAPTAETGLNSDKTGSNPHAAAFSTGIAAKAATALPQRGADKRTNSQLGITSMAPSRKQCQPH
jgi:hypothetical protein